MSASAGDQTDAGAQILLPQVLTRNIIPALTEGLDASDVLECYALVRSAPLHGIANSTIAIQKMAIGVRYRPTGAAAIAAKQLEKKPLEMTIEYGPQRFGPVLHHEAIPFVQVADRDSSFISWDNGGRVFYTTSIVTENYVSSYYMASMTGAVLNKILAQAMEYTERRKHYQPFAIYSAESGRVVRSSSSADFVQYLWSHMAKLGVEIEPILPPPVYEARLWIDSWEKVVPEPAVATRAATFYQKLYNCLEAIATNDYTAFQPTDQPTSSPAPSDQTVVSSAPTMEPSSSINENDVAGRSQPQEASQAGAPSDPAMDENSAGNDTDMDGGNRRHRLVRRTRRLDDLDDDLDEAADDDFVKGDELEDDEWEEDTEDENDIQASPDTGQGTDAPSATPSLSMSPTITALPSTIAPTDNESPGQDVEKAKQAAQEAQQKAEEAKNAAQTEGETAAADAAQAAADAAQAAAEATSNAAAQAAMDSLLSGDGSLMSSIVASCLTDPQYDISSIDEEGVTSIEAYVYRDGSAYYKLNLTSPYIEVVKVNRALPKPFNADAFGSGGDFVDWFLALVVLSSVFLMFVVLLHQMGHECIGPLYRWQRWFFNPRKYDYEGNKLDDEDNPFQFGEDGIPLSMGGRVSNVSPIAKRKTRETPVTETDSKKLSLPDLRSPRDLQSPGAAAEMPGDVELTSMSNGFRRRLSSSGGDSLDDLSDEELDGAVVPERFMRDPELVDMPNLRSTTRVAVPVGATPRNGSHHSSDFDLDDP